jgi:hypothetical protein
VPRTVNINGEDFTEQDLVCPECGAPMRLKPSKFGLFYGCSKWVETKCPGAHGAHKDGTPLGVPADKATKEVRQVTHHVFDHLWKTSLMSRGAAYRWMQGAMGMSAAEAHIGRFSREECKKLLLAFRDAYPDLWREIRGGKP